MKRREGHRWSDKKYSTENDNLGKGLHGEFLKESWCAVVLGNIMMFGDIHARYAQLDADETELVTANRGGADVEVRSH